MRSPSCSSRSIRTRTRRGGSTRSCCSKPSVGEYRHSLNLLLGAVLCVLLIACANVANLQLARAVARSKELAIRAALGAGRWRLARQLLTESTLLALLGGAAGIVLAIWSLDGIKALSPAQVPRFQEVRIDPLALMFTASIAIAAGILVGVWPALRISRTATLSSVLHDAGSRGGSGGAGRQKSAFGVGHHASRARGGAARGRGIDAEELLAGATGADQFRSERCPDSRDRAAGSALR